MIKILVDRKKLSCDEIKNRQNFHSILNKVVAKQPKKIFPWYYGAVGIASFIFVILTILL